MWSFLLNGRWTGPIGCYIIFQMFFLFEDNQWRLHHVHHKANIEDIFIDFGCTNLIWTSRTFSVTHTFSTKNNALRAHEIHFFPVSSKFSRLSTFSGCQTQTKWCILHKVWRQSIEEWLSTWIFLIFKLKTRKFKM